VLGGLPYLWDVCRKARSGCFEPFVRYDTFPLLSVKKGRKRIKAKEKGGRRYKSFTTTKTGKKIKQRRKGAT